MHVPGSVAGDWLRRHAPLHAGRWKRPTPSSSAAAAETIVHILTVGGSSCWAAAVALYAEALATRSVGRRGAVSLPVRHKCIVWILKAVTLHGNDHTDAADSGDDSCCGKGDVVTIGTDSTCRILAKGMALDIVFPHYRAPTEERMIAAAAGRMVFSVLSSVGEWHAAQRFAERWMRHCRKVPSQVYCTLREILWAVPGRDQVNHRRALLRVGLLRNLESFMGTSVFAVLLAILEEQDDGGDKMKDVTQANGVPCGDELHHCVARWYVDVAWYTSTCPWEYLLSHKWPVGATAFLHELIAYSCSCDEHEGYWHVPSAVVELLPVDVLREHAARILRGCARGATVGKSSYSQSALWCLRDAVAFNVESGCSPAGAIESLYILQQLSPSSIQSDTLWWHRILKSCCPPVSVECAEKWLEICECVGARDIVDGILSASPRCFPLLVALTSRDITATGTLFDEIKKYGGNAPPVDKVPWDTAGRLLQMSSAEDCIVVIDWVLKHCKDTVNVAEFILRGRTACVSASLVTRRLFSLPWEESNATIRKLSRFIEQGKEAERSISGITSFFPPSQRWSVALRLIDSMETPSFKHVRAAFVAIASGLDTRNPIGVDMAFLWSDKSFTWLRSEVSTRLNARERSGRWEAASRLFSLVTKRSKCQPQLLQQCMNLLSRNTALRSRLGLELDALRAGLQQSSGNGFKGACADVTRVCDNSPEEYSDRNVSVTESATALARGNLWEKACGVVDALGDTCSFLKLLAKNGKWAEAARVVDMKAGWRSVSHAIMVLRAARHAGQWQVALRVVEKMASAGVPLHYSLIAELLASCASDSSPLELVQLWLRGGTCGVHADSHFVVGVSEGFRHAKPDWNSSLAACSGQSCKMANMELFFALLDSTCSRSVKQQWHCALQSLAGYMLHSEGLPSQRVLRSTYSVLHRTERWEESLRVLQFHRSVGVPFTAKCIRLILSSLPRTEWRQAIACLHDAPRGDHGIIHRLLPLLLPVQWEYAMQLMTDHCVLTNRAKELIVQCEQVPLTLRLRVWSLLLPSLPVSMRHTAAPVYLRLALAVSDATDDVLGGVDGMHVIERSLRGLRPDYDSYASFVYYRAKLHRCWSNKHLDPTDGVAAFRALTKIAESIPQCEVSDAAFEQLTALADRLDSKG
ncbi:hypothetical protein ERJ75_001003300 [Trypanosoma vivax]|nr:hypothetical protein TRVL_02552 [Trypanosoma vivax]KAH8611230.1 hypothetical protein ERJ75_001003300 [Trypanosoma vivax]